MAMKSTSVGTRSRMWTTPNSPWTVDGIIPYHSILFPESNTSTNTKTNLHWLQVTWCLRFRTRSSTDACGWSPSLSQWNWRATEMNRSNLALIAATNCKTFGFHINVLAYTSTTRLQLGKFVDDSWLNPPTISIYLQFSSPTTHQSKTQGRCSNLLKRRQHTLR